MWSLICIDCRGRHSSGEKGITKMDGFWCSSNSCACGMYGLSVRGFCSRSLVFVVQSLQNVPERYGVSH